jgi:ubiquinone/menaquinone biosynthesis C-methylase UbiE
VDQRAGMSPEAGLVPSECSATGASMTTDVHADIAASHARVRYHVVATEWLTRCADRLCPRPVAACTLSTCERDRLVASERPKKQLPETHGPEITGVFSSAWASVAEQRLSTGFTAVQTWAMASDRDVRAFDERADVYESGWRGRLHHQIAEEVALLAAGLAPKPRRVLDVGCGTGYLLRGLAEKLPAAQVMRGIDAAPRMVEVARSMASDARLGFTVGVAEDLPYEDASFDLVVSTTSFDHWHDQQRGLAECARVLEPEGHLLLADLFSRWLIPTLFGSRRGKARTQERLTPLLTEAGLSLPNWHRLQTPLMAAANVVKP